jgi:hypothetical protein
MMPVRRLLTALAAAPLIAAAPRLVQAQCTNLPLTSPEAKLFGFYAVPLAFSTSVQPDQLRPWQFRVSLELTPMPAADPTTRTSACHSANKGESTNLASIFPRPRVAMGLPYNLEVEASYVPPLQVKNAKANLLGLALAWTRRVAIVAGASVIAQARVHTLIGSVEGPITCGADALQASNTQECWGKQISNDRFTPNVSGGELSAAVDLGDYAVFLTGGMNTLQPELQVNFQPGAGYTATLPPADRSLVTLKERLNRYTLGGGATWRMFRGVDLTGQVYTSPDDVAIYRMLLSFKL